MIKESLIIIVIGLGTAFICIANIAMARFNTVFMKSHAITKAGTIGISLLLLALYLRIPKSEFQALEILVFLGLQWLTIPLSGQYINYLEFLRLQKESKK